MDLESRASQYQEFSEHSLFSRAPGRPPPVASTASAPAAEDLPTAGHSHVNDETSLRHSSSRGISSNNVASASQAGHSAANGEGQGTDDHTSENRAGVGSNPTATDTIISQEGASSEDPDAGNASADTAAVDEQQAAGFAAVRAQIAADAAALGVQLSAEDEVEASWMPGGRWQPEVPTHGGQQEQAHLVRWWQRLVRDPFALLMHLLAFTHPPPESADSDRGASAAAAAAGDRVMVFQASQRANSKPVVLGTMWRVG